MAAMSLAHQRGRRRRLEWMALAVVLSALVAWLSAEGALGRVNHLVQDAGLRFAARPAHPDIVIVAIDDASIAAIGRWPWRRALHAELIRQIDAQAPRVIGLDVLLNEQDADYPADDLILADALQRSARVVLPVVRRGYGTANGHATDLPWPPFAAAAAQLGHVHADPDPDGIVRALFLYEGPASSPWPHFSTAMRCAVHRSGRDCPQAHVAADDQGRARAQGWQRERRTLIAYGAGPGHFPTYSYIDVLRGTAPPEAFRGKYVLIGAVASGLGDMFATPVGSESALMPGVEVVAHALDAQLTGTHIHPASAAWTITANVVTVGVALCALLLLGPLAALMVTGSLAVVLVGIAVALPGVAGLQTAPAPALLGLALAYPLWSWRRLSAAAHFLRLEMERLQQGGLSMRARKRPGETRDYLEPRINAVERATRQLRELHQFVRESLEQLPSPTLVCDEQGRILMANAAAREHAAGGQNAPEPALLGASVVDVLADLRHTDTDQPILSADTLARAAPPSLSEGRDARGRSVLVQCRAFSDDTLGGWLITLVDITAMRRAIQQRDQALHFISHDIRAPNASILTLLEMHRADPARMAQDELLQRIDRYARASLGMAESFVQLASAESQPYRVDEVDLVALLIQAQDDLWALAQDRAVQITVTRAPDTALVRGDRTLLARALANVIHNAIKFSPAGGSVRCAIDARGDHWMVSVRDEGPGIPRGLQGRLFEPYQRLHNQTHPGVQGVGLGLALVHTVMMRHGGALEVDSDPPHGAEFRLILPALPLS